MSASLDAEAQSNKNQDVIEADNGLRSIKHEKVADSTGDGKVHWTFKKIVALASLCAIWVGSQIPLFFLGACLSYVVKDLGGSGVASWLNVSYTLAVAAVSPFSGYVADLFGQRNCVLSGSLLLIVGCIVVGTAPNLSQGIAGMSVIGAGAAICELNALSGIASIVAVKHRGYFIGICTAFLLPFTPNVIYSQLIATESTWRWTIWICLIYNCIAALGILLTYFPQKKNVSETEAKAIVAKVDYFGGFLSITGITLFLVAIGSGGYTHSWDSAYVLTTLIIGIVLLFCFVLWENKAPNPIIPRRLFRGNNGIIAKAYLVAFVGGMNLYSLINFFPLTYQYVFTPNPVSVGVKAIGYGISVTGGATTINLLLSVFKSHQRELLVISAVMMSTPPCLTLASNGILNFITHSLTDNSIVAAFGGALASVKPDTSRTAVALATLGGFGVGGIYVPAATIAMTACPDEFISTAVALSLSIRTLGGSIGYSIYYNVYSTHLRSVLLPSIMAAVVKAGLPASEVDGFATAFMEATESAAALPGVNPKILNAAMTASQSSYAFALSYVWYVSIAFGACAIISACLLPNLRKYMTNSISVEIK